MKLFTSVTSVLLIFSSSALAQEPNRSRGQGYLFFAPGIGNIGPQSGNQLDIHVGGGGEGFIEKGFGVGAELGLVSAKNAGIYYPSQTWFNQAIGLGSANLSYHFVPSTIDRKFEPFVTGGYSLFFRHGTSSGMNIGGGVNVWMNENVALRLEGRAHLADLYQFAGFRIGVTFR